MPYRQTIFAPGEYYHIYNRGVAYQPIFKNKRDYQRFILTFSYYRSHNLPLRLSKVLQLSKDLKYKMLSSVDKDNKKTVEMVAYCFMPNHFHLLLKQVTIGGISKYLRQSVNSYVKFFNTKYKRIGSLFQGMFKAVHIESDEQLIHVSRYIHLNPLVSYLVDQKGLLEYSWSSFQTYIGKTDDNFITTKSVLSHFKSRNEYLQFVFDQEDYGKELGRLKHLLFEED